MSAPAVVFEDHGLHIPHGVDTLSGFRAWTLAEEFPETGRIDFLDGVVEVEMSPEEFQSHGLVKAEIAAALHDWIARRDRGLVLVDRARVVAPDVGLSVEPDVVAVLWESLHDGRAQLIKTPRRPDAFLEIEGGPDLVVEVVSQSSVHKDTVRLPPLYAAAGVREYWVVDARAPEADAVRLDLLHLESGGYRSIDPDADGFVQSAVLDLSVRLTRERTRFETWRYSLESRPTSP